MDPFQQRLKSEITVQIHSRLVQQSSAPI